MAKAKVVDLKTRYKDEIAPALQKELGVKNAMSVPKLDKVTINVGMGSYTSSTRGAKKDFNHIVENIQAIAGQKPLITKAKKAVSNFKIRQGDPVGVSVTLRGKKMYSFVNTLVNVVFPRVRDFRGISYKAFDGNGNYSVGFKEHVAFPEISPDEVVRTHGVQVNIATTATNNEDGHALLKAFGFPFKKVPKKAEEAEEGEEVDEAPAEEAVEEPTEEAAETPAEEAVEEPIEEATETPAEEAESQESTNQEK
jgi:large subunit ribosomal protein L5